MKPEKQLYQWDTNQSLVELTQSAQYVDYQIGDEVIRIKTAGARCRIPDEVLQTYGGKTCYERYPDGTYRAYSFTVLYAPKPPDYVFTPEERTTFEALTARVDAAIDEIKRRADSGEFNPKKGVDYFTDSEKKEMMESVSDGAIGEFRKVVDSATTELSDTHNLKLAKYNSNASEKLNIYDTNAEQHTTDYNRNAEVKLEAYNQNHTEKVAEYNQNAAALQTEVDRLRGECDTLAAENRKQENKISALIKLNKGQTYDILPEEGETASRTAPSGAKYVSVDNVGGKSIVWNQLFNVHENKTSDGLKLVSDGQTITMSGNSGSNEWMSIIPGIGEFTGLNAKNHRYLYTVFVVENSSTEQINLGYLNRGFVAHIPANYTGKVNFVCTVTNPDAGRSIGFSRLQPNTDYNVRAVVSAFDLTLMFGAGNEPTAEQFEAMFPAESHPYNPGEIISARTATITAGAETITTGFLELHSAGSGHDEIDMDGGQAIRNIGKIKFRDYKSKEFENGIFYILHSEVGAKLFNASCLTPGFAFVDDELVNVNPGECNGRGYYFRFKAPAEIDTLDKFIEKYGDDDIYFELGTPTTEPVTIPEALQEWLPVEPGGTVTFRNSDETKQLAVPNAASWVRKLDEVE